MVQRNSSPRQLARRTRLHYVLADQLGIHRQRCGKGFCYSYASGRPVRSPEQLHRIKSLVIPPAWTDVLICADPRGHLQATGRDDRGRKQFLYHAQWQVASNRAKFDRLLDLGEALPRIRQRVTKDLRKRTSREKTLALIVRLLDLTGMRIGNEEYARQNRSYGVTTLRRHHLQLNGTSGKFRFPGKSQKKQVVLVKDERVVRALRYWAETPGQRLFSTDEAPAIGAAEVNEYLREISGLDVTAKDLRTWMASALAAVQLFETSQETSAKQRNKNVIEVTKTVAERLGNTPAVCRKSYLDPRLLRAYQEGRFPEIFAEFHYHKRKWFNRKDQVLRQVFKHV